MLAQVNTQNCSIASANVTTRNKSQQAAVLGAQPPAGLPSLMDAAGVTVNRVAAQQTSVQKKGARTNPVSRNSKAAPTHKKQPHDDAERRVVGKTHTSAGRQVWACKTRFKPHKEPLGKANKGKCNAQRAVGMKPLTFAGVTSRNELTHTARMMSTSVPATPSDTRVNSDKPRAKAPPNDSTLVQRTWDWLNAKPGSQDERRYERYMHDNEVTHCTFPNPLVSRTGLIKEAVDARAVHLAGRKLHVHAPHMPSKECPLCPVCHKPKVAVKSMGSTSGPRECVPGDFVIATQHRVARMRCCWLRHCVGGTNGQQDHVVMAGRAA